jgi:hypothetical protein
MSDKDDENRKTHFRNGLCKHCQKSDIKDELVSWFHLQKNLPFRKVRGKQPPRYWIRQVDGQIGLSDSGRPDRSWLLVSHYGSRWQNAKKHSVVAKEKVVASRSRLIPRMKEGISNLEDNLNPTVKLG